MAYTLTFTKTVWGNKRVSSIEVTADAATQTVDTGLRFVESFFIGPISMATASPKMFPNSGAGGTQAFGSIGISAATNGDHFFIVAFGR